MEGWLNMDIGRMVYEMMDDYDKHCEEKCRKKIKALKAMIIRLEAEKLFLMSKLNEKEEELEKCREKLSKLMR